MMVTTTQTQKPQSTGTAAAAVSFVIILLIGVCGWQLYEEVLGDPLHRPPLLQGAREAKKACEAHAARSVVAPSTTVFENRIGATSADMSVLGPLLPEDGLPNADARKYFSIASYYDSQNSAGAMIRTRYVCWARWGRQPGVASAEWIIEFFTTRPWVE